MALAPGTRLGPYEILSPIGAGGMGEVYRGRDTRLDRTIALKILPERFAENAEFRQRFEREARAVSSLNHPHICALYDVGRHDGVDFLVMEYLEGETLSSRLRKGPLPPEQLLRTAIETTEALDSAHRLRVVHRDLKPGNIMLTKSGVKLLDFGLAKQGGPETAREISLVPTIPADDHRSPLTAEGAIVGTLQYMSPEQLEGKEADARSDIFALGTVLYEMVTGEKAFKGRSPASLIAAILTTDPPPISSLQPLTPPALDRLVKTCLAKDPDQRWQSARDVSTELKWIAEGGGQIEQPSTARTGRSRRERIWMAASALLGLGLAVLGTLYYRAARIETNVIRASIPPPANNRFVSTSDVAGPPVISPDGRALVYVAVDEHGTLRLWLRRLDSMEARGLSGTEDATFPFWSHDSRSVAFFSSGKLKRIDVSGGLPVVICPTGDGRGGTWGRDGTILFSPEYRTGLVRVPASGGEPTAVTKVDEVLHSSHRWPQLLPDGRHFLYLAVSHDATQEENNALYWASLDGRENRKLMHNGANATYVSGHLLYLRDTNLVAQPFDPGRGELFGEPVTVTSDVEYDHSTWHATFTASDTGVLAYLPKGGSAGTALRWIDRAGKQMAVVGESYVYRDLRISPNGRKLAVSRGDPSDLWIRDLVRNVDTRFTFDSGSSEFQVAWSPDGRRIAYTSNRGGRGAIYIKDAGGAGAEELLQKSDVPQRAVDWSHDGRYLMYEQGDPSKGKLELWAVSLSGDRKPFPVIQGPGSAELARFSPDGAWVAYQSDESGRYQVYVARFVPPAAGSPNEPAGRGKWQISDRGGAGPTWRGDGREIFFVGVDNQLTAVEVQGREGEFTIGPTRGLFSANFPATGMPYDTASDGKRFIVYAGEVSTSTPLTLVLHWDAALNR